MRSMQELIALDSRDTMSWEEETAFVDYCFDYYEAEGFFKVFCSPWTDAELRNGMPYKVLGRIKAYDGDEYTDDSADIEALPMWRIQFEDGYVMSAYPEEIILSEIRANEWFKSQSKCLKTA